MPVVVETLEQKFDVRTEGRITFRGDQSSTRRPVVELPRAIGNGQRAAGLCRDGKLARQSEIERIDGLNAQSAGVLRQIPAPRGTSLQRRRCKRL